MKRPLKLLIAVAVLAALIGGYFLVSSLTKDETPVQNGGSQYDTPFLSVTGSLVRIDYTWKGEQIVLDATANGWAYAADPSFPLSNDALATIQTVVKDIEVLRTILPEEADAAAFGLDRPLLTVTVTTDTETATYVVGGYNKAYNGYYLQKLGDPMTYLVAKEMPAALSNGLYAIAKVDAYPQMMSTNVTALVLQTADAQRSLRKINGGSDAFFAATEWFDVTAETMQPVRETAVTVLAAEVTGLAVGNCVDYAADEAEQKAYGFDTPWLTVYMEYDFYTGDTLDTPETASFTLTVGDKMPDGTRYLTWTGTKMVYAVTEDALAKLLEGLTSDLSLDEVCPVSIDSVTAAEITVEGETVVVTRKTETTSVVDPSTGETITEETPIYEVNGVAADGTAFESFFQTLTTMRREATAGDDETRSDDVYMTVKLLRNTATFAELTVTVYAHDANFYRVQVGENADALVSLRTVEAMTAELAGLK